MASYRFLVQQLSGFFEGCEFHHIPRERNDAADAFARVGSMRVAIPSGISLEYLYKPSIQPDPGCDSIYCPVETEPLAGTTRENLGAPNEDPGAPGWFRPQKLLRLDIVKRQATEGERLASPGG